MTTTYEDRIETQVDSVLRKFQTTQIQYFPYVAGATDLYRQRVRTFGSPVTLVGRAILNPTKEKLSVIGNDEVYDIAFLFSRLEMIDKLPTHSEGLWMDVDGEMEWWNRRYRIVKVKPTGQVQERFLLVVVLGTTIEGARD